MPRPPLRECRRLFFDCETGNLSPELGDMVEVAAILTDPSGEEVLDEYSARIFPKLPVDPGAAAVNGYSAEKWATTAIDPDDAILKIHQMAYDAVLVAHNASFDWGFLEKAYTARKMRWPGDYHKACTVTLAWPLLQAGVVPALKLTALTKHFGIEHVDAHTALSDARACRLLYLQLMRMYQPFLSGLEKVA